MYRAANLPADKHVFLGAEGGVSTGVYTSLNVGTAGDDKIENVQENLRIAAAVLGAKPQQLHLLQQGVSSHVEYVSAATNRQMIADGAVTDKQGIVLCIRTADCAPVLLADYEHGVIGAAHAGWRGAFGGVIANTIALMRQKGAEPDNIAAAVGPCIAQASYEVDDRFYQQFMAKDESFTQFFKPAQRVEHFLFNLEAFCVNRLQACGIKNITVSGLDTYALEGQYFSFRRNTHRGLIYAPKCFPVEISEICL